MSPNISNEAQPVQSVPGPVAILVLDDFALQACDPSRTEEVPETQTSGNCVVTPDGQGAYGSEGAGVYGSEGASGYRLLDIPHGYLVYQKFIQILGEPGAIVRTPFPDMKWMRQISTWDIDGYELHVVQVDTLGFDTATVSNRIENAITKVRDDYMITRFVLNMSFAVVPCKPDGLGEEEYQTMLSQDKELQALAAQLESLVDRGLLSDGNRSAYLRWWAGLRYAYVNDDDWPRAIDNGEDPLYSLLDSYIRKDKGVRVISVAAAGNHGLIFPFAPARWRHIVSVSACDSRVYRPNWGEIVMGDHVHYNGHNIRGTSFAAPELSYQQARYLMAGYDVTCFGGRVVETTPPLSYSDSDSKNRGWNNYSLTVAAADYCPVFPFR